MSKILIKRTASWRVKLNVECPNCEEYLDLTDSEVLQDGFEILPSPGKSETDLDIEITCNKCGFEFIVDSTEY